MANGAQIWQISAHKFILNFVGEIERHYFHQKRTSASFCLANKVW